MVKKIVTNNDIDGTVIKDNAVYLLEDNCLLNNLVLSKTTLHIGKETTGHSHAGVEELYFFNSGVGRIQIDNDFFPIQEGDIAIISDGQFHKVFNNGKEDLVFISIFQTYQR